MPQFNITAPDGTKYQVDAPEGATEQDALSQVQAQHTAAADEPKVPPRNPMGNGSGAPAATYVNGGMLGYGDEAVSGAAAGYQTLHDLVAGQSHDSANSPSTNTLGDLSKYYDENLNTYRQGQAQYAQDHPNRALAYGLGGGIATMVPAMMMGDEAAPLSLGQKMIQGAKTGAVVGGVAGFGSGEGGLENRLVNSGETAAEYGGIGAATPLALAGAGAIANGAWKGGKVAAGVVGDTVGDWINPQRAALQKVGQAIVNDATVPPSGGAAALPVEDFINNIQQHGLSPAEVGGPNIEAMADSYIQKPGSARPFAASMMQQKVSDQRDKISSLVTNALGTDGSGTNAIEMAQAAKAKIAPLAEAAFQPSTDVTTALGADPTIQRLMQNPDVRAGIPRGLKIMQNEADATGGVFNPMDHGITGYTTDMAGAQQPIISDVPNMRLIDAAKRGLDAQINDNSNEFGHLNDLGRTQAMLKSALVKQAKSLNPAYNDYLTNAANEYSLQSAAKLGRGIWNSPNKEETITQLSNLSAPEKQMALQGAVRSFIETTEKSADSANMAATKLSKPYWKDILTPLVEDPAKLDGLVNDLQAHADAFRRNAKWLGGSQTALRGQFNSDAPGSVGEIISHVMGKITNSGGVNDRATSILMDQNPATSIPNMQRAIALAKPQIPVNYAAPAAPAADRIDYRKLLGLYYGSAGNNSQGN